MDPSHHPGPLYVRSLREQVYDYLRAEMARGGLQPGAFLDLNALAADLGISRTPLRDALLQLAVEGFVEILPRRGFRLKPLTLEEIRNLYEIVGALEAEAIRLAAPSLTAQDLADLRNLNAAMARAVDADDAEGFLNLNLNFHQRFLDLAHNPRLSALANSIKQRLYDWPRRQTFLKAWEARSVHEHARLLELLESGAFEEAARHHRDVHWSFEVQKQFIFIYYQLEPQAALGRR